VFLPARLARATLILAFVVAAFFWVFGQAFGQILTGGATDPNSAPLLALLAVAYWPSAAAPAAAAAADQAGGTGGLAEVPGGLAEGEAG
jgi:hypothetical protein